MPTALIASKHSVQICSPARISLSGAVTSMDRPKTIATFGKISHRTIEQSSWDKLTAKAAQGWLSLWSAVPISRSPSAAAAEIRALQAHPCCAEKYDVSVFVFVSVPDPKELVSSLTSVQVVKPLRFLSLQSMSCSHVAECLMPLHQGYLEASPQPAYLRPPSRQAPRLLSM